jgi:hypothetical protein
MTSYLHIACRPYHLLVDARHVLEVLELEAADVGNLNGCRLWRGSSVRVVDLRVLLGETAPSPPHGGVVYAESETDSIMLLCDTVVGLLQSDATSFRKLPHSARSIAHLVDALLPDAATGQLLFHLKPGVLQEKMCRFMPEQIDDTLP